MPTSRSVSTFRSLAAVAALFFAAACQPTATQEPPTQQAATCPEGQTTCEGRCVDAANNPAHCGVCGNVCAADKACRNGDCVTVCPAELTDCAGTCRDTNVDRANCGGCSQPCADGEVCSAGQCAATCGAALELCGSTCRDTQTDRAHCGDCDSVCDDGDVCVQGACVATCAAGLELCDTCRDTQTDRAHCGGCDRPCANGEVCADGVCSLSCPDDLERCEQPTLSCKNLAADPAHCGACDNECPVNANELVACVEMDCVRQCLPSFGDCETATDGCETDLRTSHEHCGACDKACPATVANGSANCAQGACTTSCSEPYGDCNGDVLDGCETNLDAATDDCGECGVRCLGGAQEVGWCLDGTCQTACQDGYADCDGGADGCETEVLSNPDSCGACGVPCPEVVANGAAACTNGACEFSCDSGFQDCNQSAIDGCEITDIFTNYLHCGFCFTVCTSVENCLDGVCTNAGLPRLVMPASGALVSTARPSFHFEVPSGFESARLDVCTDRACTNVVASSTAPSPVTFSEDLPLALVPFTTRKQGQEFFWRVTGRLRGVDAASSPTWPFVVRSNPIAADLFHDGRDVNGDGYGDALIGGSDGIMRLVLGGAASVTVTDQQINTVTLGNLGHAAIVGDINLDGYADIAVMRRPLADGSNHLEVIYGSAAGLGVSDPNFGNQVFAGLTAVSAQTINFTAGGTMILPALTATLGSGYNGKSPQVYPLGDMNGDRKADFAVFTTVTKYLLVFGDIWANGVTAGPKGAVQMGAHWYGVAAAGDVDGDGRADIALTMPTPGGGGGVVFWRGTASDVNRGAEAMGDPLNATPHKAGSFITEFGDRSRDGFNDFAAMVYVTPPSTGLTGLVVHYGAPAPIAPDYGTVTPVPMSAVGGPMRNAFGNGYDGFVFLSVSSAVSLMECDDNSFQPTTVVLPDALVATALATGTDFDGDGRGDVIILAQGQGRVFVATAASFAGTSVLTEIAAPVGVSGWGAVY